MTDSLHEQHRPPFVVHDTFLETPFATRLQGLLRHAWEHHSWHIIAAVPGSGKSWELHDLVLHSGAYKEATGRTRLPIIFIRAPANQPHELKLATAFAASFGIVPRIT